MFTVPQSSDIRHQSQEDMSVQDAKELAFRILRYPTMRVLYTQYSLQDAKFESDEEQGHSKRGTGFLKQNGNFENSQELRDR
jgi:hypothetical protein